MAEGVLFNIAEEIIKTLGSLTAQEVALWWGLKDQLRKLNDTVTSIKAVIQDAEEQAQKKNHQIEVWLKKLREAVYDAEDLLDDFSTQVLRKQLMLGKRVSRELRLFFSRSNQFVYGLRMGHRVKVLRERLDDIETDSKRFNFVARQEEGASLTTVREQTTSSEPEGIVGRVDVRKIIKGAVGSDSDDQLESLKKKLEEKIEKKKYLLVLDDVWDGKEGLDGEKWDTLMALLPRDSVGSKIVVTTRSHVIAKFTSTIEPHVLEGLSLDESWDLFRRKAFPQGQESGHVDERIRKEIVERCCGVPLVIKAIARICDLTRHVSFDMELDLSLPSAQRLRTLVLLQGGKWDEGSWESICREFRRLRVLEYMPRGIGKLTSLQTLSCFVVAKKSSSKSEMIGGLDELSRLNELRGRLEIRVEGYEGGSCISQFEGAKLIDKEYLQSLTVRWDPELDSDSDIDLYDKMLQSLQPNSSLQELRVEGYGGMRFPSWVSNLSNLASIVLKDCGRLKHIPPLDGIPYLEELSIWRLDDLESIDSEGVGGKGALTFFPSLKRLVIKNCGRLKGWWKRWSRDEMNDDRDESTIEEGLIMLSFPRLSSLEIDDCPNLTSMPLFPTLDEDLYLHNTSSMPLQQTMKMTSPVSSSSFIRPLSKLKSLVMLSIDDMESLPEVGLQNLSSLQQLLILGCGRLKSLPLPDQGMHSLQQLDIINCRGLKSLSESESQGLSESESQGMIPYLPSLQFLRIYGCSEELSGRARGWGKEREEEWPPNIKHIPDIVIDKNYIQKEGRYEISQRIVDAATDISYIFTWCSSDESDAVIGLGFDKVEKVFNDDFIIEDGTGWIRFSTEACDKLDRNLFTLHTLHIHFICRTKLQLQSKSLIQYQMVESSVHSGVEYYPPRESARSLEDEGLRRSTVLMNFSPTKLDHDVYGLKGCLQGFNWLFATRYMLSKQFTVDELNIWRAGLSRSATLVSLIIKKPTSSAYFPSDELQIAGIDLRADKSCASNNMSTVDGR
ncbi:hypothetical protein POTOM_024383 [Populus tomentosa]|uniref:Uncharacterized protein n=1 Tax=Populus tomentosa TaxID=118781 RepID=A0A8X7ZV70_POPTO|nr:hypothetical protein POTOM_024383 [Populus tomentosa]